MPSMIPAPDFAQFHHCFSTMQPESPLIFQKAALHHRPDGILLQNSLQVLTILLEYVAFDAVPRSVWIRAVASSSRPCRALVGRLRLAYLPSIARVSHLAGDQMNRANAQAVVVRKDDYWPMSSGSVYLVVDHGNDRDAGFWAYQPQFVLQWVHDAIHPGSVACLIRLKGVRFSRCLVKAATSDGQHGLVKVPSSLS